MHTDRRGNTSGQKCHKKETEKELKRNTFCTEIQRMCNKKCVIIPVATGVKEIVTKGTKKNLQATPAKYSIDSVQKTAVLVTSHIMQKVLQSET